MRGKGEINVNKVIRTGFSEKVTTGQRPKECEGQIMQPSRAKTLPKTQRSSTKTVQRTKEGTRAYSSNPETEWRSERWGPKCR